SWSKPDTKFEPKCMVPTFAIGAEGGAIVEANGRAVADLCIEAEPNGQMVAREAFDIKRIGQCAEVGIAEAGAVRSLEVMGVFEPPARCEYAPCRGNGVLKPQAERARQGVDGLLAIGKVPHARAGLGEGIKRGMRAG